MTDFTAARLNMVESQVRTADVTDLRIQDAMRALPREQFVPSDKSYLAYADMAVDYAPGRALLKPRDVAKLLQAVRPVEGERALAIAAPYAGAVLREMGLDVTNFDEADLRAPTPGNYDLIIAEGAVSQVPSAWLEALALDGRLAVVERTGPGGQACLYVKAADGIGRRTLFDATPPILAGFEKQPGFAF